MYVCKHTHVHIYKCMYLRKIWNARNILVYMHISYQMDRNYQSMNKYTLQAAMGEWNSPIKMLPSQRAVR